MKPISDAEWEVMRVIWTFNETTSKEIISVLSPNKKWSTSTIKTLLARLVEKGLVTSYRQGKHYIYSPLITEEEAQYDELKKTFARICQKKHAALLLQLLDESLMTKADIQIFNKKLIEKKENTVEEVSCNCIPGQCLCRHHRKES